MRFLIILARVAATETYTFPHKTDTDTNVARYLSSSRRRRSEQASNGMDFVALLYDSKSAPIISRTLCVNYHVSLQRAAHIEIVAA